MKILDITKLKDLKLYNVNTLNYFIFWYYEMIDHWEISPCNMYNVYACINTM